MRNKVYLFQPQSTIIIRGVKQYWLPYSVACVWSYANKHVDGFELGEVFFKREYPDKVLERMDNPAVCAFSCYVWNQKYNLMMAKAIKDKYPNCVIEFGGPQVDASWSEKYDFIDSAICGYGELAFQELLIDVKNGNEIKPVYERKHLELDTNQEGPYESPYLSGVMDKIIEDNPDVQWSVLLESTRGCPHRCTFCEWGNWFNQLQKINMDIVKKDIDWMQGKKVGFVMMGDANFGIFKDRDIQIAKWLREAADHPDSIIDDLSVQYTKNQTDAVYDVTEIFGPYEKRGVNMSVQSMSQPVLKAIKRQNMKINRVDEMIAGARARNLDVHTELILGLPEETLDSWKDGMAMVLETGFDGLDVWLCQLFGSTEMNLKKDLYGMETIPCEDYISFSKHDPDEYPIKEISQLVNKTNTMTTEDIIEGYLFSWIIIMFHVNGFTQYVSQFYDFREFYDNIMDCLDSDSSILGDHYRGLKQKITTYLTTGKIKGKETGHTFGMNGGADFLVFWDNRNLAFDFVEKACNPSKEVMDVQRNLLYNPEIDYPIEVQGHKIWNPRYESDKWDIFYLRRSNLLKNRYELVEKKSLVKA